MEGLLVRPVRDGDADGLTRLVADAYAEYPGCVLDLPGVDEDLTAPATTAARRGGRWWALEHDGRIVGSVGTGAVDDLGRLELKRLYLAQDVRGRGLATRLVRRVEAQAAGLGATTIELWSDTRFDAAHRRYQALGYVPTGEERDLHDPSATTEYRFVRGIEPAPVTAMGRWDAEDGTVGGTRRDLPDGAVLVGTDDRNGPGTDVSLEVDAGWRPRVLARRDTDGVRRLTTDGAGRWWLDGRTLDALDDVTDIDARWHPALAAAAARRLGLGLGESATVDVAGPGGSPAIRGSVTWSRTGVASWIQQDGGHALEVALEGDGLPGDVRPVWRRSG